MSPAGTKETERPTLADAAIKVQPKKPEPDENGNVPEFVEEKVAFAKRLMKKPWIAHLIRMNDRFSERLGSQFAAAITYFSFFSLVPVLMVSFATAGFILAGQPDLLDKLKTEVSSLVAGTGGDLANSINNVIDDAIEKRFGLGIIALVIALYSGIGWMTNVREAVQAQWRPLWEEDKADKESFVKAVGKDLLTLVVLGLSLLLTVVLSAAGSAMTGLIAGWLGLDDVGWITAVLKVVPILLAFGVSTLMFHFLYTWLPTHVERIPKRKIWRGAAFAAFIFELFKLFLSLLLQLLGGSATAAAFGSIIALLAFFNLMARMVLMVAAWISTSVVSEDGVEEAKVSERPVVVRPNYRVVSVPALVGGLGIGAAGGWVARKFTRRRG